MGELSVYKKMTSGPVELFEVLKKEIGVKSDCVPFAIKAIEALNSLKNLTEIESVKAAFTFLANLQTLYQGGITPDDYDKIDFVERGRVITISARVEAFYRAAKRKGYTIVDTIVPVPKEDADTTYFKENFHNGEIVYTLEDKRIQPDREITAERLISGYFRKYLCRLEVYDVKRNKRVIMVVREMSNEEVLAIAKASSYSICSKYNANELNTKSFWYKWTSQMVEKTIIRRSLKRVREVLPELKDTIFAFEHEPEIPEALPEPAVIDIPVKSENVDINNLTDLQYAEAKEMRDLLAANPKLAINKADEIMRMFNGRNAQEVINTHYASIAVIMKNKKMLPIIAPLFEVSASA